MALKLIFDSPKGSRPKAGQLYLMKPLSDTSPSA